MPRPHISPVSSCLLMFVLSAKALAAPAVDDYAYQALLGEADQPLQRVELPVDVITSLAQRDLADIAVFDADGKRLPHSVVVVPDIVTDLDMELPFHGFDRFVRERSRTVTTREQNQQDGSISELRTTETLGIQTVRKDYLVELKPDGVSRRFRFIELQWTHEPASQVLEVKVEVGNDLDRLRTINARKSLTNRESDDPEWHSIRAIPENQQYLRLTAVNEVDSFVLARVTGHYRETSPAPMLTSPVELEIEETDDGRYYSFALPSAVAAEAMRIIPAEADSVISGDLYTAWPNSDKRVRVRYGFRQHNLTNTEVKPSQPIKLPRRAHKEIGFTTNQSLADRPTVELIYRPYQVYFLGNGNKPYILAWGNHAPEPQAAELTSLLQRNLRDAQDRVATVTAGAPRQAGGAKRLAPEPVLPWKKWLLWALLVLATMVTGRMAYRLYREMNAA